VLGKREPGLGHDCIHFGSNSGYQAINLAFLWGAKRIVLLGFDCKSKGGKPHWFGKHPKELNQTQPYEIWLQYFERLATDLEAAGVEVLNCSPGSAIDSFKRISISEVS
jgi:hypothetical protein